jgi:16S rRNA processing protein RimM
MINNSNQICIAKVIAAHGIKGQVKLRVFTSTPEAMLAYGVITNAQGEEVTVKLHAQQGQNVIATIVGVVDRNAAEAWVGEELWVQKSAMPQPNAGEYYYNDLIGLQVRGVDGVVIGAVLAMYDFGAGDVMEIALLEKNAKGKSKTDMVLLDKKTLKSVNLAEKYVVLALPEVIMVKEDKL